MSQQLQPISSLPLPAALARLRSDRLAHTSFFSGQKRWAVGGLLLAQAMVVLLYLILVDNVSQVERKRAAAENEARERHSCTVIRVRLMRDECFARLTANRPVEVLAVSLAQQP